MAVTKVTLLDSPEKMRPEKSPSMEYSILMGQSLRSSKSIGSEKEEPSKANQKTDN
tara:strand:- start:236 stop:403 length:168 start_codon:yes stop_codon:yes gene_type:complete